MKFGSTGKQRYEKRAEQERLHKIKCQERRGNWFAWRPVRLDDSTERYVWLEWIWQKWGPLYNRYYENKPKSWI